MIYNCLREHTTDYKPVAVVNQLGTAIETCYADFLSQNPKPVAAQYKVEIRNPDSNQLVMVDVKFRDCKVVWESQGTIDGVLADLAS